MPSNQQRREAAKRKLQRQLVRREQARSRRRRTTLIAGTAAVVLIAAGVVWLVTSNSGDTPAAADPDSTAGTGTAATGTEAAEPTDPCTYTAGGTAAKDVKPPDNVSPAKEGTVGVTMDLNGENVEINLDRSKAPCSVNSFLSLASQGFYDDTDCHRLTTGDRLNILQCGDPSGKGNGTPGYSYASTTDAETAYPVGTVAMANTGPQGEGSQFFIVYDKTEIDPSYSVIGTVSKAGMKVVDAIADKGVTDDRQEGAPVAEAKIGSIKVPDDAVTETTQWQTESSGAEGTGALPTALPPESVPAETVDGGTGEPPATQSPATQSPATESAPVSKTTTN